MSSRKSVATEARMPEMCGTLGLVPAALDWLIVTVSSGRRFRPAIGVNFPGYDGWTAAGDRAAWDGPRMAREQTGSLPGHSASVCLQDVEHRLHIAGKRAFYRQWLARQRMFEL